VKQRLIDSERTSLDTKEMVKFLVKYKQIVRGYETQGQEGSRSPIQKVLFDYGKEQVTWEARVLTHRHCLFK